MVGWARSLCQAVLWISSIAAGIAVLGAFDFPVPAAITIGAAIQAHLLVAIVWFLARLVEIQETKIKAMTPAERIAQQAAMARST